MIGWRRDWDSLIAPSSLWYAGFLTKASREGSMKRREFLAISTAIAWPLAARAQEPRPVIGFLSATSLDAYIPAVAAGFLRGLNDSGFVEGQNVTIEYRGA